MLNPLPPATTADNKPVTLSYAPADRRRSAERLANAFAVVAITVVLGSGSIAWVLLMGHR